MDAVATFTGFKTLNTASSSAAAAAGRPHQHADSPPLIGTAGQQRHEGARGDAAAGGTKQQPAPCGAAELRRITQEYDTEGARLAEQLSLCGIQQQQLSDEAQAHLQQTAALASALQLVQATPQLVLAAWALLLVQDSKATRLQHTLARELTQLQQQRAKAKHKLAMLQRVLADVQARQAKEASRVPDRTAATDALLAKEASYQQVLASETKRLKRSGLTPEITHGALLAQHEGVQALQVQLADLQEQLAGYYNLPATLEGARAQLEQAKAMLEDKHAKFQTQLADTM